MTQIIFTKEKTTHSFGYIGGGVEKFPQELWAKIPHSEHYQTHLLTLYPNFYHESDRIANHRISIFISLENHALGGVKSSLTDKFTVHSNNDLSQLNNEHYAIAIFYKIDDSIDEYNLSDFSLPRQYMNETSPENQHDYAAAEHEFFEEHGMGLDVSKLFGIFYFEQDVIFPPPKFSATLQLLEEDIEDTLNIFQHGIGYFFMDRNIKKLKHGDQAGLFFIQH